MYGPWGSGSVQEKIAKIKEVGSRPLILDRVTYLVALGSQMARTNPAPGDVDGQSMGYGRRQYQGLFLS